MSLILAAVLNRLWRGLNDGPHQKNCCRYKPLKCWSPSSERTNLATIIDPTLRSRSLHLALVVSYHYVRQRDHLKEMCVRNSIIEWSLSDRSVCEHCCAQSRLCSESHGCNCRPLRYCNTGLEVSALGYENNHTHKIRAEKHRHALNDLHVNQ